jgi:hypothetical protein
MANVTDFFWEFCKAATCSDDMDEFKATSEYDEMNVAVNSGTKLEMDVLPPLRKIPRAHLPKGCVYNPDETAYVFDGVNELFFGVRDILDPHATTHCLVLEKCISRINIHIDTETLTDSLISGVWITSSQ